jgi:NADPH-dependent 2,4-dienoyl-CoA reductase/sulfur reductase-like enzyme
VSVTNGGGGHGPRARTAVVVGASLAGLSSVRALRAAGFDGRLVLLSAETELPYDRPPLSKDYLAGAVEAQDVQLVSESELTELEVEWRPGEAAVSLRASEQAVLTSTGQQIHADYVVIATGARARRLPGQPALDGVHVLRTLADATALRLELVAGARLVVVGAGFIGAEVASTAHALGLEVSVVEALAAPLAGPLGAQMGAAVAGMHRAHGVELRCGVGVVGVHGTERVREVELSDGTRLAADVVVVGIGTDAVTDWLSGSGVVLDRGVRCDTHGRTALPAVAAVGDVARADSAWSATALRVEHWTHALQQPTRAVAALLAGGAGASGEAEPAEPAPYFWSEQYGRRLQFAGVAEPDDDVRLLIGGPQDASFLALYERDGEATAVLGIDQGKEFTRWRRSLRPPYAAATRA